jgi:hypothetical protein
MGHRAHIYKKRQVFAESLPSPNAVVPEITVEIRVYWPEGMDNEAAVEEQLDAAYLATKYDLNMGVWN